MLLGGSKFATQSLNLAGIKQYLMAIMPLSVIVLVFPSSLPGGNFTVAQMLIASAVSSAMYGIFLLIQTRTHQKWFIYYDMSMRTKTARIRTANPLRMDRYGTARG